MKGLVERTTGDGIFLTVKHNSIVRESKTEQPGFEKIVVTNPRSGANVTKYIKRYSELEALVKKMEWYDTEQKYETRYMGWKLHLDADGRACTLDLPFESIPSRRFMKLAENLDFTQPVEFSAWKDRESDATAFSVKQNSVVIRQKYTREEPHDLPPPIQNFKGKWNFDNQMQFLKQRMIETVIPRVQEANQNTVEPETKPDTEDDFAESDSLSDTLESIRRLIVALAGSKEVKGATKTELMMQYFEVGSWEEVTKLPEPLLKDVLVKLDDLVPF